MKDEYDVLVVGAGPGGSIAAKTAAEHGLDVLLIEKRAEIGNPVRCAEGVGKESIKPFIESDPSWISAEVKGARIYSPDGTAIEMSEDMAGPEVGYVLERKIFDRALALQAARAGVEVMVKTRATGLIIENGFVRGIRGEHFGDDFTVRANIVIGADGVESKVGRWAGINTTLKLSDIETCAEFLMTDIDFDQNYCDFYVGNEIAPGGYAWIFPKGKHEANVGVGVLGSRVGSTKAIHFLKKFVDKSCSDGHTLEIIVGGVPVSGPLECTITNGLMLVGDAARMTDPITGGGIVNAMITGQIAGEVAAKAISKGDTSTKVLSEYETRWKSAIEDSLDKSLHAKEVFTKMPDEQLNTLAHSIKDVNFSELTATGLLTEITRRNPKMLCELRHLL